MKTLITAAILACGPLTFAQNPISNIDSLNYESRESILFDRSKVSGKNVILKLSESNQRAKFQVGEKTEIGLRSAMGSEGVGGGNGVQGSDGKIIPLDIVFAQENRVIDVKSEYPDGYNYFQLQIDKIAKAIPSFADDIERKFSNLTWIASGLELIESKGCLNNLGIFRVRVGDKQIVLACQNSEGEVYLNVAAIRQLKDSRHLGVVFLHEAFVKSMLSEYNYEEYPQAEYQMISKVVPYILSNQTLNPVQLYDYAQVVRYVREFVDPVPYKVLNPFNQYSLEVFENRRQEHQSDQDQLRMLADQKKELTPKVREFHSKQMKLNACKADSIEAYMRAHGQMKLAFADILDLALKLSRSLRSQAGQAQAMLVFTDVSDELLQIEIANEYESRMNLIAKNTSCEN